MLVAGFKPGHDGAVAVIEDGRLIFSLEPEKDSFERHSALTPMTVLDAVEQLERVPDVLALGGWQAGKKPIGAGYHGVENPRIRRGKCFGKDVEFFTSSHVRSHIMMALGMAPAPEFPQRQAVLVWEGVTGGFYIVDGEFRIERCVSVLSQPGARYAFLYALADPTFPDSGAVPDLGVSGKLMALAAYGDPARAHAALVRTVDRILAVDTIYPAPKGLFRDSPVYNAGVESEMTKDATVLLEGRIFDQFARAAKEEIPPGIPLRISGGCGLNCEWNARWRSESYFSSVFVPPCTNDSGSALGTAIDALCWYQGEPHIQWDVYRGLDFEWDSRPDPARWSNTTLDPKALSRALARGRVVAWVQGKWEIGPRALGNRSLLAEPFHTATRDRLNTIKKRESYRPIAPCCRAEDLAEVFDEDFADPHMLYFRTLTRRDLAAVAHVDDSARVQTVSNVSNAPLHELLCSFAGECGTGILCNTSLNFHGSGFINRMSDLTTFCEAQGIDDMVVDQHWFQRR